MRLTERRKWLLVAGAASAVAAPLAERVVSSLWRRTAGEDPPVDVAADEIEWRQVLAFAAASALVVGVAQVLARRGAALAWHRAVGKRPPRPRALPGRRRRPILTA